MLLTSTFSTKDIKSRGTILVKRKAGGEGSRKKEEWKRGVPGSVVSRAVNCEG